MHNRVEKRRGLLVDLDCDVDILPEKPTAPADVLADVVQCVGGQLGRAACVAGGAELEMARFRGVTPPGLTLPRIAGIAVAVQRISATPPRGRHAL